MKTVHCSLFTFYHFGELTSAPDLCRRLGRAQVQHSGMRLQFWFDPSNPVARNRATAVRAHCSVASVGTDKTPGPHQLYTWKCDFSTVPSVKGEPTVSWLLAYPVMLWWTCWLLMFSAGEYPGFLAHNSTDDWIRKAQKWSTQTKTRKSFLKPVAFVTALKKLLGAQNIQTHIGGWFRP